MRFARGRHGQLHETTGSHLFSVKPDQRQAANDTMGGSTKSSAFEAAVDAKHRAMLALLGFDADTPNVIGGYEGGYGVSGLLTRLIPGAPLPRSA